MRKKPVRLETDAARQLSIYSDNWSRFIVDQSSILENFGLDGGRSSYWRPENPSPLNFARSANSSNYFTDFSASATGDVPNPVVKAIQEGDFR